MPFDKYGDSIVPGSLYAIGRGTRLIVSETRYDLDADVLLVRRHRSNENWARVDEIDQDLTWLPCDSEGNPVLEGTHVSAEDPIQLITTAVLRARVLKDQICAIERDLASALQSDGDPVLADAIMQAIHGDGSVESVLELVES